MKFNIHKGASIHMGCKFDRTKNFSLGENSTINQFCRIDNRGKIDIGMNVSISSHVKILTADHDLLDPLFSGRIKDVKIDSYCFIGTDAMILPGGQMKQGAALAAKSVLRTNADEYCIYAGIPAKQIGKRPAELTYTTSYRRWFN